MRSVRGAKGEFPKFFGVEASALRHFYEIHFNLLQNLELLEQIVKVVVKNAKVPVTVKIRKGCDITKQYFSPQAACVLYT